MRVKIGIEIHQQLDTGKLFCSCPSKMVDSSNFPVMRKLRVVESELGAVDRAALFESERNREYVYTVPQEASCLVELDEEPPHEVNPEAFYTALQIAKMLDADVFDVICFMRKIVIDGSNTAGFQRTALIACNGRMDGTGIATICLEEDSARKVREEGNRVYYNLDRLGVPLIEIATEPCITSAGEAQRVAYAIGMALRRAKVKRALGSIRQDLNVSVDPETGTGTGVKSNRVEIKGVQRLGDIEKVLGNEIERHKNLYSVREKLMERVERECIEPVIKDISHIFEHTESRMVEGALKSGKRSFGMALRGFSGLLSMGGELRLAREFVSRSGLAGILHGDELPAYGISEEEVRSVREELSLGEKDSFVIVLEKEGEAERALRRIMERALECFDGVPPEVRKTKGEYTEYMRPMPGSERMYPETDVPYIAVGSLADIPLPETLEEKKRKIMALGANEQQCSELLKNGYEDFFEALVRDFGSPQIVLRILNNTLVEMEREGINTEAVDIDALRRIMDAYSGGLFAREAIENILRRICRDGMTFEGALASLGTSEVDEEAVVNRVVERNRTMIREKGDRAFKPIMGEVMKEMRGKVSGASLSEMVRRKIREVMDENKG